jgi:hypothetical protein
VLSRIADRNTPRPDGGGTFAGFSGLEGGVSVASEGTVAFHGGPFIYTNATGPLTTLVSPSSPVPGRPLGVFGNVFWVSHDRGRVAFTAVSTDFHTGVYVADGRTVALVAAEATPIPDGVGTFTGFGLSSFVGSPSLSGDDVVFVSQGDFDETGLAQSGVYGLIEGALVTIADRHTPVPGGRGARFGPFNAPADIHEGTVVFRNRGVYRTGSAGLETIANERTRLPGSLLPFKGFGSPAVDHGSVAVTGEFFFYVPPGNPYAIRYDLRAGLYSDLQGVLDVVVDTTRASRLDGRRIKSVQSGTEALSDGRFVFRVTFRDDTQAIYLARPIGD